MDEETKSYEVQQWGGMKWKTVAIFRNAKQAIKTCRNYRNGDFYPKRFRAVEITHHATELYTGETP